LPKFLIFHHFLLFSSLTFMKCFVSLLQQCYIDILSSLLEWSFVSFAYQVFCGSLTYILTLNRLCRRMKRDAKTSGILCTWQYFKMRNYKWLLSGILKVKAMYLVLKQMQNQLNLNFSVIFIMQSLFELTYFLFVFSVGSVFRNNGKFWMK
jgi:hypothetical protein